MKKQHRGFRAALKRRARGIGYSKVSCPAPGASSATIQNDTHDEPGDSSTAAGYHQQHVDAVRPNEEPPAYDDLYPSNAEAHRATHRTRDLCGKMKSKTKRLLHRRKANSTSGADANDDEQRASKQRERRERLQSIKRWSLECGGLVVDTAVVVGQVAFWVLLALGD